MEAVWALLVGQRSLGCPRLICRSVTLCNVSIQSPCSHVMLTLFASFDRSHGLPDQSDGVCTQLDFCTAGSSSEVHDRLTCHLHCGVPRATTFLLNGTATHLQTAQHGCDVWAGSFLAGPEAILRLPSSALLILEGETHQPMLIVCLMPPVQLQDNMTAWVQALGVDVFSAV